MSDTEAHGQAAGVMPQAAGGEIAPAGDAGAAQGGGGAAAGPAGSAKAGPARWASPDGPAVGRRPRRRWLAAGLGLVLVGAGAGAAWAAGAFGSHRPAGTTSQYKTGTYPVTRRSLMSQTPVDGTLGYARSYTVRGQGGGSLTWLPPLGKVIRQGQMLYQADLTTPVALLYGSVPAWRLLDEGVTGADVTQLNHDLVSLGYASSSEISSLGWDYFSWETKAGVEKLQSALGISSPSGSLALGSVVFEPGALRVNEVLGSLGNPASGPVLAATSDRHVVTIALNAAQQSQVKAGDAVSVTLPDGAVTPGLITSVGAVASGSGASATIPVTATLTRPSAAGTLDQAPVTVTITTGSVSNALVVPVDALLAQPGGGYAVEVVGPGGRHHLVSVTPGTFDDNAGLVSVTGSLTPGQQVVVPAS